MSILSIALINKNGERHLDEVLRALSKTGYPIFVMDSGSTDQSEAIAKQYGCHWITRAWPNDYAEQRNALAEHIPTPWVFWVDVDEVIDDKVVTWLKNFNPTDTKKVYTLRRINHLQGKPARFGAFTPDRIQRLYHRETYHWVGQVHERLEAVDGSGTPKVLEKMPGSCNHYTYDTFHQCLAKGSYYARLWAEDRARQGRRPPGLWMVALRTVYSFLRSLLLQGGVLDGALGIAGAFFTSFYTFQKYAYWTDYATGNVTLPEDPKK